MNWFQRKKAAYMKRPWQLRYNDAFFGGTSLVILIWIGLSVLVFHVLHPSVIVGDGLAGSILKCI